MTTISRCFAAALCLATTAMPAHAALSGFYDSAEQIKTILESPEVADALRQLPIKSIEREGARSDGNIEWEVETQDCEIKVLLHPQQPEGPGKVTYTASVTTACK